MKAKVLLLTGIILVGAIAIVTGLANAESKGKDPQTKLIFVHGIESRLMNGDPLRLDKIGPGKVLSGTNVLPLLLADGWRIKEVHASEVLAGEQVPSGYVIIEK